MFSSQHPVVDAVGTMHFEGNVIPHAWFQTLKFEKGKPDTVAIIILSEIVYWYRPSYVRDETTGSVLGVKKKFQADLLQKSYDALATQFGFSKRQVQEAVIRLEKLGVIERELRNIVVKGTAVNNVLFIKLNPENLARLTFGETYPIQTGEGTHLDGGEGTLKRGTNTEITTEITTNKEVSKLVSNEQPIPEPTPEQNDYYPPTDYVEEQPEPPKQRELNALEYYQQIFGMKVTRSEKSHLMNFMAKYPNELIHFALDEALERVSDNPVPYAKSILEKSIEKGILTYEAALAAKEQRKAEQMGKQQKQGGNQHAVYESSNQSVAKRSPETQAKLDRLISKLAERGELPNKTE